MTSALIYGFVLGIVYALGAVVAVFSDDLEI